MLHEDPNPDDQVATGRSPEALRLAQDTLSAYTSARSRKDFTRHQLFAILALKTLFRTDYQGIAQLLTDLGDLGLDKVPHYSTLCYAAERLKKREVVLLLRATTSATDRGLIGPTPTVARWSSGSARSPRAVAATDGYTANGGRPSPHSADTIGGSGVPSVPGRMPPKSGSASFGY